MKITPAGAAGEVVKALIGAIGVAFVVGQFPGLQAWMRRQMFGANPPRQ